MKDILQILGILAFQILVALAIGGLLTWLGAKEYLVGFLSGVAVSFSGVYLHKALSE